MKNQYKWILICFSIFPLCSIISAQDSSDNFNELDSQKAITWLENLYDAGTDFSGDTVILNNEAIKILHNEEYRNLIYPDVYTWSVTTRLMSNQELKKAFWYLLNLYAEDDDRDLIIKTLLTYNSLFRMDEIMEATYKTYAILDPQIGSFENGRSQITAPHILERKLNALKEILFLIKRHTTIGE